MEKPWMPALVDILQAPPTKEQPEPERPSVPEASPDNFAHETDSQSAPPTKVSEPEQSDAPPSLPDSFADELSKQWAPATRPPLEFGGSTYWNESWSDRVLTHMPAIVVVLLFVAALGALSFFYRVQVGHSLVLLGEKISGEPTQQFAMSVPNANATPQPAPPPTQSASSPVDSESVQQSVSPNPPPATPNAAASATSAAAPALGAGKNSEASPNAPSNASPSSRLASEPPQAAKSTPEISSAHGTSQADFLLAQAALHQARTPEAKARAAQLLWTAVTNGSSDAEIALADVYGRGDGVQKNCLQARILLAAATDKHNPRAAQESDELRVYGCR
jgi:hypothetical protein